MPCEPRKKRAAVKNYCGSEPEHEVVPGSEVIVPYIWQTYKTLKQNNNNNKKKSIASALATSKVRLDSAIAKLEFMKFAASFCRNAMIQPTRSSRDGSGRSLGVHFGNTLESIYSR